MTYKSRAGADTISHAELIETLHYGPKTGVFTWIKNTGYKRLIGKVAGTPHSKGYINIIIKYKFYYAHRLAWFYVHGKFPEIEIDHINLNKSDNRIVNLREADSCQNMHNRPVRAGNSTGYTGVSLDPVSGKFKAESMSFGVRIRRRGFVTPEAAYTAYLADIRVRGEYSYDLARNSP